jgi:hypothetical protein
MVHQVGGMILEGSLNVVESFRAGPFVAGERDFLTEQISND